MNVETFAALFARHVGAEPKPWIGGTLVGPTGVGKTRLAFERALSVGAVFVKSYRFVELARAATLSENGDGAGAERLVARIYSAEHLVLDDLGTRKPSDFAYDAIYRLLDERFDRRLATLVTSNLPPSELVALFDERVVSRLRGFGPVEVLRGDDRRFVVDREKFLRKENR